MPLRLPRQSRLARRGADALAHVHLDGRVILVGVFLARESMDMPGALLIAVVDDPGFLLVRPLMYSAAIAPQPRAASTSSPTATDTRSFEIGIGPGVEPLRTRDLTNSVTRVVASAGPPPARCAPR
jgi:hypothetical protein